MSKLKNKKRGLSLIELVVALSLMTIILMIVGPFFISNYKSLNKTSNQIDFQRESKVIMNYFSDAAMESEKIYEIQEGDKNISLDKNNTVSGNEVIITFYNGETEDDIETSFGLNNGVLTYSKKLESKNFKDNGITIGNFVKSITYTAIPDASNFEDATSIKVKIVFDTNNAEPYEIENIFTFRNRK